jgi:hypothetical protein
VRPDHTGLQGCFAHHSFLLMHCVSLTAQVFLAIECRRPHELSLFTKLAVDGWTYYRAGSSGLPDGKAILLLRRPGFRANKS